jgi:Tol biopolymer transport system component
LSVSTNPPIRLAFDKHTADSDIYRMEIPSVPNIALPATRIIASSQGDIDPEFSPDGAKIAFRSDRSGYPELYISNSDGTNPVRLTSFSRERHAGAPVWSHDGKQIAFDSQSGGNVDIFIIHVETLICRQLTTEPSAEIRPSWSADDQWIYFGSNRTGPYQIWKVRASGGTAQ